MVLTMTDEEYAELLREEGEGDGGEDRDYQAKYAHACGYQD